MYFKSGQAYMRQLNGSESVEWTNVEPSVKGIFRN